MAIYLLPVPKDRHAKRPFRTEAISDISTECLPIPELRVASDVGPGERSTKWKALRVKGIKGVMRWM